MQKKYLGQLGEQIAVRYLSQRGYHILERNYHCHWGELDIVAEKEQRLYFVEVKTRTSLSHGRPEEALTYYKRRAFFRAVQIYLRDRGLSDYSWQLDVLAILLEAARSRAQIRHIPNISIDTKRGYSVR